jgi:uncharacterized membrane protein required for colicin V production
VSFVDLLVVAGLVIVATIGWRSGLIATTLGFAGFLAGALAAAVGVPALLAGRDVPAPLKTFAVLGAMVVAGLLGQALFGLVGGMVRDAITFEPVRFLDSLGGLAVSAVAFTFAAWLLLSVTATLPVGATAVAVRDSRSYTVLERFMAAPTEGLLGEVRSRLAIPRATAACTISPIVHPSQSPLRPHPDFTQRNSGSHPVILPASGFTEAS